ncbi:MAG: putative Ni/Fe-hydrogenase 2 b-type cytochrome subunit [Phycisphaerae bacterium]|nr:putative Ni/Fe-hydrogenase 2 b-type cytochrome subunit [Phycisphaerae bacterium]
MSVGAIQGLPSTERRRPRVSNVRLAMSGLVVIAFGLAGYRFWGGLGAATNLTDSMPWGLWIGFDMLCGIALAAGGFVLAGAVHIFGLRRYEPFVRPAIVTALLGYLLAIIGLLMDLGRPWAIWHPLIMWQPHSVMFEVAWCVMLYTTVLFLEFLPIVFERFGLTGALRVMRRVMIVFIVAGIVLSTVHQSSLGSLFVMMEHRLHPLWFTPLLPLLFLMSSLAVGVAMVIFEAILSGMIFGHRFPMRLLGDLARALPLILSLYVGLRLMDLNGRGELHRLLDNSLETWAFILEMVVGVLLPGVLLLSPEVRYNRLRLFGCSIMVIVGVVMNRLNVSLLGLLASSSGYLPRWIEILVSGGVVAGGLLVLSVMNHHLPIVPAALADSRGAGSAHMKAEAQS